MNKKVIIIILSVMILGLSIGYAALSSSLNITGSARLGATADSWNINFKNAKCTGYNYAEAGNIEIKNKTTIELSNSKLKAPKDYIICNFDIVNDGTIDAKVTSITNPKKDKFTYTGSGANKTTDEETVKNGLVAEMKYQDNTEIKLGDELKAGETKKAYIKISLSDDMSSLPSSDISISNIFGQIIYGQYKVGDTDITDEIIKTYDVSNAVYYNPVSNELNCSGYTESNSLNKNKTGCMKWYVIASNDETMNLLLDHNTTYYVAWNSSGSNSGGPETVNEKLASDVSGWSNEAKNTARLITADEVWSITSLTNGKSNWSSSTSIYDFWLEGSPLSGTGTSKYAWLFDYTDNCTGYGCNKSISGTLGYWTSSPYAGDSGKAWHVSSMGQLAFENVSKTFYGVRPVITISKS